jgi:hypothetical protein
MLGWLRSVFSRQVLDPARIVPGNPAQARTLARADALLRHPVVRDFERRGREMRESFARADARLAAVRHRG